MFLSSNRVDEDYIYIYEISRHIGNELNYGISVLPVTNVNHKYRPRRFNYNTILRSFEHSKLTHREPIKSIIFLNIDP